MQTTQATSDTSADSDDAIQRVANGYLAFRCRKHMAPLSRAWSAQLKEEALSAVGGGDVENVAMSDKLFSGKIPSVKQMAAVLRRARDICNDRRYTLPHPEPAVRLVKRGQEAELARQIEICCQDLRAAAEEMNRHRDEIKATMRTKLGSRYATYAHLYDADFTQLFLLEFRFVNTDVPSYLAHNRELYAAEQSRVREEFRAVVRLQEQATARGLLEVVQHLATRLQQGQLLDGQWEVARVLADTADGTPVEIRDRVNGNRVVVVPTSELQTRLTTDGRKRRLHDSSVQKVFEELRAAEQLLAATGIGQGELQGAFEHLRAVVGNRSETDFASALRTDEGFKSVVAADLQAVSESILSLSVIAGSRDIIRRNRTVQ